MPRRAALTQAELDALLERCKPEPRERAEDRRVAQRELHRLIDSGHVVLGPGLKMVLPGTPGATESWP